MTRPPLAAEEPLEPPSLSSLRRTAGFAVYAVTGSSPEVRTFSSHDGQLTDVRVECDEFSVRTQRADLGPPIDELAADAVETIVRVDAQPVAFTRVAKEDRWVAWAEVGDVRVTVGMPAGAECPDLDSNQGPTP